MRTSAGLLVWRRDRADPARIEVLLAHPGGPLFARKDDGVWSIPKGEYDPATEDALAAARREFAEELGQPPPAGEVVSVGTARQASGKVNAVWAVEGDLDVTTVTSNLFELAWPPRSGRRASFPEVDRAGWFDLTTAAVKLFASQRVFLERLAEQLGIMTAWDSRTGPSDEA